MPMTLAELAALQIKKHGRDRYPTWEESLRKLVEEVGELNKEINRSNPGHPSIAEECADVALSLSNFCTKVGVDLDEAVLNKVLNDDRNFGSASRD
jgi:NTP pyrophosphatase (non-canonical NTP hydrolase)